MPSGKTAQPEIMDNKDGTVTVKFAPTEAGLHEMHIKYNGTHIPGQHTPHARTRNVHAHTTCTFRCLLVCFAGRIAGCGTKANITATQHQHCRNTDLTQTTQGTEE